MRLDLKEASFGSFFFVGWFHQWSFRNPLRESRGRPRLKLEKSWKKIGKEREKPRITGQGALAHQSWIDAGSRFSIFYSRGNSLYLPHNKQHDMKRNQIAVPVQIIPHLMELGLIHLN